MTYKIPYSKNCEIKDDLKKDWECYCPLCEQLHTLYFYWTGKGRPKKYCPQCLKKINTYSHHSNTQEPSFRKHRGSE